MSRKTQLPVGSLKLSGGADLGKGNIQAISHLIASSVEGFNR